MLLNPQNVLELLQARILLSQFSSDAIKEIEAELLDSEGHILCVDATHNQYDSYTWYIPQSMKDITIEAGDILLVQQKDNFKRAIVCATTPPYKVLLSDVGRAAPYCQVIQNFGELEKL